MSHQDIADQVATTLGDCANSVDVDAVVTDLVSGHGPIDSVDAVDSDTYWETVRKHDATQA